MTRAYDQAPLWPKRYFWRRFLAYLIDSFVLTLLVSIPVMTIWSLIIGISFGPEIDPQKCSQDIGRPEIVMLMGAADGEQVNSFSCHTHDLLHGDITRIFAIGIAPGPEFVFPRFGVFHEDSDGLHKDNLLPLVMLPNLLIALALPIAFAIFSAYGRQPLGKKLLGLRVVRTDDSYPPFKQALVREYWKYLPVLLLMAVVYILFSTMLDTILASFVRAAVNHDFGMVVAIIPAAQLLLLVWWVGPFLFWNGQTWHDRLAGTKVVRK